MYDHYGIIIDKGKTLMDPKLECIIIITFIVINM